LVTEAQLPMSQDIANRQRRYLIMMGIRVVCFAATVLMFALGAGWYTAIPAVGAIAIPYFAVVFANGGREPNSTRGFRAYEARLPERYTAVRQSAASARSSGRQRATYTPSASGPPPHNSDTATTGTWAHPAPPSGAYSHSESQSEKHQGNG
jgi:hypothetical protein